MVNDFNVGNIPVFLISLKAGGTGLNLIGADVVIHYDPWCNGFKLTIPYHLPIFLIAKIQKSSA